MFANGESGTLTNEDQEQGADDPDGFAIDPIDLDTNYVLSGSANRAALVFELDASLETSDARLEPGDSVSISITTASDGTAFVEKRAPRSIDTDETYRL